MSRNHYHITVKCSAGELLHLARITKSKPTSIDLYKDSNSQIDRMLTKYHRNLGVLKSKAKVDISQIESMGYEVVRLKVEEVVDNLSPDDVGKFVYLEGHLKVKSNKLLPNIDGFILSSNNEKCNTRFYNFRIRNQEDYQKVISGMSKLQDVVEKEFERVIIDTNEKHDKWWG